MNNKQEKSDKVKQIMSMMKETEIRIRPYEMIFSSPLFTSLGVLEQPNQIDSVEEKIEENRGLFLNYENARVIKEIAIAQRINNSDEVEIEEYYEDQKDGEVGASVNATGGSIGVKASNGRLTKRIFKFKGLNHDVDNILEYIHEFQENDSKTSETEVATEQDETLVLEENTKDEE